MKTEEITSFSEQSLLSEEISQKLITPLPTQDPYDTQTLLGFLSRPFPILETQWDSGKKKGDLLATAIFPSALFSIKAIAAKIRNFAFFRGGVRIGIRLNGTKFHYGKLLVAWSPATAYTGDLINRTQNLYSASSFPHVIISPTENEVNEIVLPFALPTQYIPLDDLSSPKANIGSVFIYVLNPLRLAANTNNVGVTMFANFERPEICGMSMITPAPLTYAQALTETISKSRTGIVSGIAESISGYAGSLRRMPIIGGISGTVSQVAAGVGMIASAVGYCKPNSVAATETRILKVFNNAWSSGLEQAPIMGLKPDNAVSSDYKLIGSLPEEMDLKHILSTPSLLAVVDWKVEDVTGAPIFTSIVSPMAVNANTSGEYTLYNPTMTSWVSNAFRYWRGSLRYCVQITCSGFHSGRLRVSWEPTVTSAYVTTEIPNIVNHILDVQQEVEFFFTIPYLRVQPWSEVHGGNHPFVYAQDTTGSYNDIANGRIRIDVINPLTHPDKPVPQAFVNVWVSAGDDFQLGFPTSEHLMPNSVDITRSQGLTREYLRQHSYPPIINATGATDDNLLMGEKIDHIKDLMMRPSFQSKKILSTETGNLHITAFYPNFPRLVTTYGDRVSYFDWFRYIYRFSRGSVTHKFNLNNVKAKATTPYSLEHSIGINLSTDTSTNSVIVDSSSTSQTILASKGLQVFKPHITPTIEGTVPYYAGIYSNVGSDVNVYEYKYPGMVLNIDDVNAIDTLEATQYISAGDDFTCGFLVGPPIVAYKTVTNNIVAQSLTTGVITSGTIANHTLNEFNTTSLWTLFQEGPSQGAQVNLSSILDDNYSYIIEMITNGFHPQQLDVTFTGLDFKKNVELDGQLTMSDPVKGTYVSYTVTKTSSPTLMTIASSGTNVPVYCAMLTITMIPPIEKKEQEDDVKMREILGNPVLRSRLLQLLLQ